MRGTMVLRTAGAESGHPRTGPRCDLRVMLIDEQALFRAGLRALLERDLGAQVTAECATPEDALERLEAPEGLTTNIVIIGTGPSRGDGVGFTRQVTARPGNASQCIVLTTEVSAAHVKAVFDAGAQGYLLRGDGAAELAGAVRAVRAGQRYVSPIASGALVDNLLQGAPVLPHHLLSPRQLEVLRLVARGKSTKTIARDLGLSTKTVDAHRYQISQRLQVHDVAGMVRYAIRHALVGNNEP